MQECLSNQWCTACQYSGNSSKDNRNVSCESLRKKKTPTNQSKKQQNISKINKEQFGIQNAMQTVFVD